MQVRLLRSSQSFVAISRTRRKQLQATKASASDCQKSSATSDSRVDRMNYNQPLAQDLEIGSAAV